MFNWSLAIFIVIGFFLRFSGMFDSIVYDEAYTFLTYSSKPILVAIGMYNLPNNHIFNSFLVWIVNSLIGGETWWIRLPNFLAWCLLCYQLFIFIKKKFGLELALLMVAALSCSTHFVTYSALARGYCLHLFLMLNVWFLIEEDIDGNIQYRWLIPMIVSLSLWTLPTGLYSIAGLFTYWILQKQQDTKKIVRDGLYSGMWTLFLYSPALIYVLLNGTKTAEDPSLILSTSDVFVYVWSIFDYLADSPLHMAGISFLILFLLYPVLMWQKSRRHVHLWLCILVVPIILVAVTKVVPPFNRVWLWFGPFLFFFAFLSLKELAAEFGAKSAKWATSVGILLVALLLVKSVGVSRQSYIDRSSGSKVISQTLKSVAAPGDFIAFYGGLMGQMEYWEAVKGNTSFLPMKRYPVAGNFKFAVDRLHAEPAILRKDVSQLKEVRVWTLLDENGGSKQLDEMVAKEFPRWKITSISGSSIAVGGKKIGAFMLLNQSLQQ